MLFERYSRSTPSLSPATSMTPRDTDPNQSTSSTPSALSQQHSGSSKTSPVPASRQRRPLTTSQTPNNEDKPLTCLFYFFHSQMSHHVCSAPDPDLVSRGRQSSDAPVHRLDTLLTRLKMHATFSPLIASFDTYPIAVESTFSASVDVRRQARRAMLGRWVRGEFSEGGSGGDAGMGRDTVLLMEFRTKRGREEWMASREWQEFYQGVEGERVCRRMPHVRCAGSLRGLGSVREVLSA